MSAAARAHVPGRQTKLQKHSCEKGRPQRGSRGEPQRGDHPGRWAGSLPHHRKPTGQRNPSSASSPCLFRTQERLLLSLGCPLRPGEPPAQPASAPPGGELLEADSSRCFRPNTPKTPQVSRSWKWGQKRGGREGCGGTGAGERSVTQEPACPGPPHEVCPGSRSLLRQDRQLLSIHRPMYSGLCAAHLK